MKPIGGFQSQPYQLAGEILDCLVAGTLSALAAEVIHDPPSVGHANEHAGMSVEHGAVPHSFPYLIEVVHGAAPTIVKKGVQSNTKLGLVSRPAPHAAKGQEQAAGFLDASGDGC